MNELSVYCHQIYYEKHDAVDKNTHLKAMQQDYLNI